MDLRSGWRGILQRLNVARFTGQVQSLLGDGGAKQWLRSRATLDSPVFKATAADSPCRAARDTALRAMDAAMAQLTIHAASRTADEGISEELIAEMRRMADEAQSLAPRLGLRKGRTAGDAPDELRRAMGELRMPSDAEREIQDAAEELRQGPLGAG